MQGIGYGNSQYFNPRQIGGLKVWLDATDPSANGVRPANAASISSFVDKSRTVNNFSQATGALQPVYATNTLNGKPTVEFTATKTMSGTASSTNIQYHCYVVGKTSASGTQYFFGNGNAGVNGQTMAAVTTPSSKFGLLYGGAAWCEDGNPDSSYHIFNALWDGAESQYYIDTVEQAISNSTVSPTTPSGTPTLAVSLIGNIAEVLLYDSAITDIASKISVLNNYVKNKWGL